MVFSIQEKCVNTIRCLSAAQVQTANSGHPGTPMGCAPLGHTLFRNVLRFDPGDPSWMNRDVFVLSSGHGCALLYSLLHVFGYALTIEDLKAFRQLHSKTPGHPEPHLTPGVEVPTGPLGQGIAQAVGIAIACQHLKETFNKENFSIFSNHVFCLCGEGCLMEGISSEAASLAGHLNLKNLTLVFDANDITIDGSTALAFSEDVAAKFRALSWDAIQIGDANTDLNKIQHFLMGSEFQQKPTLLIIKTVIGYGSNVQGSAKAHGSPLGMSELLKVREKFGFHGEDIFEIEKDVKKEFDIAIKEKKDIRHEWDVLWRAYESEYPEEAGELKDRFNSPKVVGVLEGLPTYGVAEKPVSTRGASEKVLNYLGANLSSFMGGSADLRESNKTHIKNWTGLSAVERKGRYIFFGVREHAMVAICNGMAAFGGSLPFWATFLNFTTYAWPAIRLSALAGFQVLGLASHDSIELGQDGPTHQPVETMALARATPNLTFIRPCDANEVSGAYLIWLQNTAGPTIIALCRDPVPILEGSSQKAVEKGVYVLKFFSQNGKAKIVLGSSGTEVHRVLEAVPMLSDYDIQVLSCPCWSLFLKMDTFYKDKVLARHDSAVIGRVYVEASATLGAERLGFQQIIEMTTFGASAPANDLMLHFGFAGKSVASKIKEMFG